LRYNSASYRVQHYKPTYSFDTDGGDVAQAYHNVLNQSAAGLYTASNRGSPTGPTHLDPSQDKSGSSTWAGGAVERAADEGLSPQLTPRSPQLTPRSPQLTPRRARSSFTSPRPAGTGRSGVRRLQGLPLVGSALSAGVSSAEGTRKEGTAEPAEASARNWSEDAGWRRPYVPSGSVASGGLLPFRSTPESSPRPRALLTSLTLPTSVLSTASCR
jgi:hypothetical protein